ncbi:ATP-binding protein [Pedobacter metabolipauper]|uniref:histidine kinase n=1 Tax=Pedobacter metabolipauper TaxID=425513 RepID=A0A4R6SSK4_9SPHI|nr:ATP-binding protein [Pedobacter metabolipauper]TDQ06883.1 GAF domain-containing protein [Pedobacter metabolipauper]
MTKNSSANIPTGKIDHHTNSNADGNQSKFPIPTNEMERIAALRSYHILDTAEEKDFDDLTMLASAICQTPIALVSLVDKDRQWFKSHRGLPARETPRAYSFCAHGITSAENILVVPDAKLDHRFKENPLVTGDPNIVFYAGVPLVNSDGFALGSLCVIDRQTRELTADQIQALVILANHVVDKLELRRTIIEQAATYKELTLSNEKLVAAHHELKGTQLKLKQAIETGKMDTWSINPATFEVTMSDFIKEMFGFPLDREIAMEEILAAIDPDYREMLLTVLKNAVEKQMPSDTEYPITNQITNERLWVKATGKVYYDSNGIPSEYSGMFMDITERKLDEIRKNDFIGMVSHELKTPLTSLNGYIQILHKKAAKSGDVFFAGLLNKSVAQIRKMTTMINSFLNVSRLQSGKILLQKQEFGMDELIRNTIEDFTASEINHTISYDGCGSTRIYADSDKIGNVISNLISNAIKYSPIETDITIACRVLNDEIEISVKDDGMGISEQDLERLFERYYRVETKSTELISGFGIGLYLCSEIIQIHQGKIWAESEIETGSTFYFTLPLTRV